MNNRITGRNPMEVQQNYDRMNYDNSRNRAVNQYTELIIQSSSEVGIDYDEDIYDQGDESIDDEGDEGIFYISF